ncbi:MAG: phage tail sheath subtilisin-like domain-containing protein [Candidatus Eisenbacteria bacterium]|uniref:Phage tail sheath subtilisin-like domain-containing protein n=1 Tax=Eiseniibacteriota bacterium TaxID=2212470 RepID=A0A956NH60_UNCEI|nr:phage tail sheath subtilisin-like domain-containing protein [Candidatus Eisenbacteria bacterium]
MHDLTESAFASPASASSGFDVCTDGGTVSRSAGRSIVATGLSLLALLLVAVSARAATIEPVPTGVAAFVGMATDGPLDTPVLVSNFTEFKGIFGDSGQGLSNPYLPPSAASFFLNGGERLWVVRVTDDQDATVIGIDGGSPGARTGLQTIRDVDEVSVVAVPGSTTSAVQSAMIALCEELGDRMAILDSASTDDMNAVLSQRAALDSPLGDAAIYFPWVKAAPTGESLVLPPSGFVAGAFARTAPPDAPVGTIVSASDVSYRLTAQQTDVLTQAGVNAIRYFSGPDVRIWGARTLSSDPEWKYVAIRRVGLFLLESIYEGTEWAVFEDNDETLWNELRAVTEDFLLGLFQQGWFQGSSPSDAFFVRCDRTSMTQQDIDEGRTILIFGIATTRPAEFLILQIVHERANTSSLPADLSRRAGRIVATPNPSRGEVTLRLVGSLSAVDPTLPVSSSADSGFLRILDATGREVRRWSTNGSGPPSGIAWNGRDDFGRSLPSGTYYVRFDGPHVSYGTKLLRVR